MSETGIEKIEKKEDGRASNGGARPGAGRKPRGPGKVKFDLRMAAQEYTPEALEVLRKIANDPAAPPAARVSAANGLLDRGHGKPVQALEGTGEGGAFIVRVVA